MISGLEKINLVVMDEINDPVFLGNSSRPQTRSQIFDGLGFPNSLKRIVHNSFDQFQNSQGNFAIRCNPKLQVFSEFRLKDGVSEYFLRGSMFSSLHGILYPSLMIQGIEEFLFEKELDEEQRATVEYSLVSATDKPSPGGWPVLLRRSTRHPLRSCGE
jgi:hypothetical protein